jgi:uncharacterized phage protein (TIGR02218 family)
MTYDTSERGQQLQPIEVYDFARGSQQWHFTSAEVPIVVASQTYLPRTMRRSTIETTTEKARNNLSITCRRDFEIAELFRVSPPTDVISVTVRRCHQSEPDDVAVLWKGRVLNCEWRDIEADLTCEPVSTSLARPGLRRLYQRNCPHVLYSTACGVSKASYVLAAAIDSVSGLDLSVSEAASQSDGYYAGGFIEWELQAGVIERRFIKNHVGAILSLSSQFVDIGPGVEVSIYPGCNHSTGICNTKFGNLLNYGGFPHIPQKNPFGGSPIY